MDKDSNGFPVILGMVSMIRAFLKYFFRKDISENGKNKPYHQSINRYFLPKREGTVRPDSSFSFCNPPLGAAQKHAASLGAYIAYKIVGNLSTIEQVLLFGNH